jgi:hypothetical protein
MSILGIFRRGLQRVYQARKYILIVYLLNVALAAILGNMLAANLKTFIGPSLAGDNLRRGFDDLWFRNFQTDAGGIAATFDPSVVGIGAIFNGLDTFLRGGFFKDAGGIIGVGILYWGFWICLSAGFIAVFLKGGQTPKGFFFQNAGQFFPTFLALAMISAAMYLAIFSLLMPWLSEVARSFTREIIDERQAFLYTLGKYAIVWMMVYAINIIFDYSKIIAVEKNLSLQNILSAPGAATRFILKQPFKVFGLFFLSGFTWLVLLGLYWLAAPGVWQASWFTIIFAFLIGQIYIFSRIAVKCLFFAGETVLYQSSAEKPVISQNKTVLQETI